MSVISVIVPVYNAENYLDRCIDSILAQSYTDFELILVDDGSPDRCGEICDNRAEKDHRIKVVHQENQGVSVARNTGLDHATGEYVFFCDSDDTIPQETLNKLYYAIQDGYDLTTGYFEYVESTKSRNLVNTRRYIDTVELEVKNDFANEFDKSWQNVNYMSCDGKLYRREIIEGNHIRFNSGLVVFEDFDFVLTYLDVISSLKVIDSYVYSVFCEKTDAPHSLNRSRLDYVDDYIKGDDKLKAFLQKQGIEYSEQYWRTIKANLQIAYDALWSIPTNTKKEKKEKLKRISEVLRKPQIQHMIEYQEFIYSRAEYHLLKRANAFTLDRYYRFQKWMKKYFV